MKRPLSHFFAYVSRLRWIKRWGLMRNAIEENVATHSWEVATLAHALAIIRNRHFGGQVNADRIAAAALYHDATEVITGDMPTPVKYHSQVMREAFETSSTRRRPSYWRCYRRTCRRILRPMFANPDGSRRRRN